LADQQGEAVRKIQMLRPLALLTLQFAAPALADDEAVPATKNYAEARDVIMRHIDNLVPAPVERPRRQEKVRGTVTGIDERNDRITLRLASDSSGDFRVQDPLVFNAVRDGDRVEITVEDIDGKKTIVGLKKE
jgi:Cu/Ag efflux protein CusF